MQMVLKFKLHLPGIGPSLPSQMSASVRYCLVGKHAGSQIRYELLLSPGYKQLKHRDAWRIESNGQFEISCLLFTFLTHMEQIIKNNKQDVGSCNARWQSSEGHLLEFCYIIVLLGEF